MNGVLDFDGNIRITIESKAEEGTGKGRQQVQAGENSPSPASENAF